MTSTSRHRVLLYLGFLLLFTVAAAVAGAKMGGAAGLVMMWTPALAAIVASLVGRRPFRAIGWKPWPLKWLALGWVLPMLYAFPAYLLVWATGLGAVPSPTFLERARLTLGMPAQPNWLVIIAAFGFIAIVNLLPATILSLGEEIGWRGFLVPELTTWIGFRSASLFSGIIWCTWHLPGVLSGAYGSSGTPKWYQLLCFTTMVITTGIILAWLRLKSGSIWPAAIMHATHNGVIQAFFDRITADTGSTRYFIGEFGAALLPFTLLLACYYWSRSRAPEFREASAEPSG